LLGLTAPWFLASGGGQLRGAAPPPGEVARIAQGIRAGHDRLLRVKGGIAIRYRLDVEQDPKNAVFIFEKGLDGSLNIKWPVMRCRVEGPMSGFVVDDVEVTRPNVREANYNFETHSGVGRDGKMLGQVLPARHAFSAVCCFPLIFQHYVEADQYYVPREVMKTEYWLPNALQQQRYEPAGTEVVDGIPCRVLKRPGLDTLWVATGHGHVVCKREFHYGVGQPLRERVLNSDLKEVAPGLWLPHRQVKESFAEEGPAQPELRLTLKVLEVRVGNLRDEDVRVVLTKDILRIEDQIQKRTFATGPTSDIDPFDAAVERAKASNLALAPPKGSLALKVVLVNVAVVLSLALVFVLRRRYRKAQPGPLR
jgi:hypothetical protein